MALLLPRRFRGSKAGQGRGGHILTPSHFAFGDGQQQQSTSSVLPTWNSIWTNSGVTPITVTNKATFDAAYVSIADTGTIRCQAGDYGSVSMNLNKRVRVLSLAPPFTQINCTPFYNLSLRKTGLNDNSATNYILSNSATPDNASNRVFMRPLIGANSGDVLLYGIRFPTSGGSWGPDYGNGRFANNLWLERCYAADCHAQNMSPTGNAYGSNSDEVMLKECWLWADGLRPAENPPAPLEPNLYTDYGSITHRCNKLYFEDCIFEGCYNHFISLKAKCGQVAGPYVNRCVFIPYTDKPDGGSANPEYNMVQVGQNEDNYRNPSTGACTSTGDNTVGYTEITNCTFMDQVLINSRTRLVAVRMQNAVGARVEGNWFWPNLVRHIYVRQGDLPCGPVTGKQPWSGGLLVKGNRFYSADELRIDAAGASYGTLAVRLEDNTNMGSFRQVISRANASDATISYGPNSGYN